MAISIHALVKRATIDRQDKCVTRSISIHALVKRATLGVGIGVFVFVIFQSTPS